MTDSMQADTAAPVAAPEPAPVQEVSTTPQATTDPHQEVASDEVSSAPSLFDDSVEETSERPEWLQEKFKSGEELAKSYQELEKKLGAHQGAPDEYALELREELQDYAITNEDPFAKDFAVILKDNGVNQKTYNEISNLYFEKMKADEESIANAQEHQFSEDCKSLGNEKLGEIKESIKWAKEVLPEETYEMLRSVGDKDMTVGLMINQFHHAYTSKNYAALPEIDPNSMTPEDLRIKAREMLEQARKTNDPVLQKKAKDFYERLYSE